MRSQSLRFFPLAVAILLLVTTAGWGVAEIPESYLRMWDDPAVNERIDKNIEQNRKGDATIQLVTADGKPVPGASLDIRQTDHAFLFGCNAFVLGQLDTPELNRKYEERFVHLFNFATVPFYWAGTEPTRGELRYAEGSRHMWRRPPTDRFPPFARKYGVTLKGHPLLWHAHNPPWLPDDPEELRRLYRKRFAEIAERYADDIPIWDVVNESLVCPKSYPLFTPEREYVAWAFGVAERLFPESTTLMINDVTTFNFPPASDRYFHQVTELLDQGVAIRGIGFQFHYFRREALDSYIKGGRDTPNQLLDVYEKFAEFDLPLYITEITLPSAGEGGDELQARVARDHYRLWFSAPRMAGITWWNLGDGTAVQGENEAKGGLVDDNLDPKPSYAALDKLINEEWTTKLATSTDQQGTAEFRGFFGKYAVTVTVGDEQQEFELDLSQDGRPLHRLVWEP